MISIVCLLALLGFAAQPSHAATSISSYYQEMFPWLLSNPSLNGPLTVAEIGATTAGVWSSISQSSPINSVYFKNVTVDAQANLAYPFTGNAANGFQFTYGDVDTGIDVLPGGKLVFWIPAGTGQQWCFELGRGMSGTQYCAGAAGHFFDSSYNSKINGAWISADPNITVPNVKDVDVDPTLASNLNWPPITQYGSSHGFTWTRSGSVVFRIGKRGNNNVASNLNPNEMATDYDSVFDSTAEAIHPLPSQLDGIQSRTIVSNVGGRLYLACFRWNFWPRLNYGQVTMLINYTSPVVNQLTWSSPTTTLGTAAFPAIVATQPVPTPLIPVPDTLTQGVSYQMTLTSTLAVENMTYTGFSIANPNAGNDTATQFLSLSSHFPSNVLITRPDINGGSAFPPGGYSLVGPALSIQPVVYSSNQIAVDLSKVLVNGPVFNPYFGIPSTTFTVNSYQMWYVSCGQGPIWSNSSSPFYSKPGGNGYAPANGNYFCELDTGINVVEGSTLSFSTPASATWSFASYWNDNTVITTNAQGSSTLTPLTGCNPMFGYIFPNASTPLYPFVDPASGGGTWDNSGCNSDSLQTPQRGAMLYRLGSTAIGHSFDYGVLYPSSLTADSNGNLVATYKAPNSGRLYLASGVAAYYGNHSPQWAAYSGSIPVAVAITAPTGLSMALTWSPATASVPQPYYAPMPTALTTSALQAAGLKGSNNMQFVIPDTFTSSQSVTVTFWVFETLAESDTATPYFFAGHPSPVGASSSGAGGPSPGTSSSSGVNSASSNTASWASLALVIVLAIVTLAL